MGGYISKELLCSLRIVLSKIMTLNLKVTTIYQLKSTVFDFKDTVYFTLIYRGVELAHSVDFFKIKKAHQRKSPVHLIFNLTPNYSI